MVDGHNFRFNSIHSAHDGGVMKYVKITLIYDLVQLCKRRALRTNADEAGLGEAKIGVASS